MSVKWGQNECKMSAKWVKKIVQNDCKINVKWVQNEYKMSTKLV